MIREDKILILFEFFPYLIISVSLCILHIKSILINFVKISLLFLIFFNFYK